MRRKIHKQSRAESDLIEIWEYTLGEWDDVQADKYLDELNAAIGLLVGNPDMGAPRDYVRAGYRVLFVNRHAIYYSHRRPSTSSVCSTARWIRNGIYEQR